MAKDMQPFLFDPADAKKVVLPPDYIKQINLRYFVARTGQLSNRLLVDLLTFL